MPVGEEIAALNAYLTAHIPLVGAMRLSAEPHDTDGLILTAPLSGNHNDKRTVFGGALASALILAGWAVCWLQARRSGLGADIVIRDCQIRYHRALDRDFSVHCPWIEPEHWARCLSAFRRRGRAAVSLEPAVFPAPPAASMTASYALLAVPAAPGGGKTNAPIPLHPTG